MAGLPSLEVVNLQVQLANAVAECDEAKRSLTESNRKIEELMMKKQELEDKCLQTSHMLEEANRTAETAARVAREETEMLSERKQLTETNARVEAESLQRRVSVLEAERGALIHDRATTKGNLETLLDEEKAHSQKLSASLQISEKVGCGLREKVTKLEGEANENRRKIQNLERGLETARNSLQQSQQSAATSEREKDRTITDLRDELKRIRQHMESTKMSYQEQADQVAAAAIERAKEDARLENEECLAELRKQLTQQFSSDRGPLLKVLEETKQEAARWKERMQECDQRRQDEEANAIKEIKRMDALKEEIVQLNEELQKSKRQMTGDELKNRLESLKEVVSHTLKEKAELEAEVTCLKERLASQDNRGGVVQDLQERLQTVKDMNGRLDSDNEDLRMRLHTAHATLRQHHITLTDSGSPMTTSSSTTAARAIRTPGGRKLSSSRTSMRSSSSKRL